MSKQRTGIVILGAVIALVTAAGFAESQLLPSQKSGKVQQPIVGKKLSPISAGALTVKQGATISRKELSDLRSMCDIKGQIYAAGSEKVVLLDDKGAVTRTIKTAIKTPTIARQDDATLIIGDCGSKIIYTMDIASGQTAKLLALDSVKINNMPRAQVINSGKLMSVASDGKHIYAAFSAGFSSSILKIDPLKGEVVAHGWAPGDNPAAMVYDKDNLFVLEATGKQIRRLDKSLKPSLRYVDIPAVDGKGIILRGNEFQVLSPSVQSITTIQTDVSKMTAASTSVQLISPNIIKAVLADIAVPQKYAVLICGDIAESCYYCDSFWNDTLWMYKTLLAKGYTKENIYVLYGNGADFASANPRYQYGETITDFPATVGWVNTVFDGLKNGDAANGIQKVDSNDSLFVWTFDHGGGSNPAYLCLMDGDMSDTSFAAKLNAVSYRKRAIYMQQCRSGGFIDNLANNTTYISTACRSNENAHAADTENEVYNGVTYWHGEYNYHITSAISRATPSGAAVNADTNSDGKVSAAEAHQWNVSHESRTEVPQSSDTGGVGGTFTF